MASQRGELKIGWSFEECGITNQKKKKKKHWDSKISLRLVLLFALIARSRILGLWGLQVLLMLE